MGTLNKEVYKKLREAGFNPPVYVEGCGSVTDFIPDSKVTGIYVLHLADGTRYVGQSTDVSRRFSQHSLNIEDIRGFSFRPIPKDQLSDTEKQTVSLLENIGVKLRNILLASFTHAASRFSDIMSNEEQERWLSAPNYVDISGERIIDDGLRLRYSSKFNKFMADLKAHDVISFLQKYFPIGIPAILKGEVSYWAVSCFPASDMKIFCRVNIYWQEVITIFEEKNNLFYSFHLSKSLLKEYLKEAPQKDCEITDHKYVPGGDDQINLIFKGTSSALSALQDVRIQKAIRKFNLGLTRKGLCQYGRYHCFELADKILET
jgi:hypothetical protein